MLDRKPVKNIKCNVTHAPRIIKKGSWPLDFKKTKAIQHLGINLGRVCRTFMEKNITV